jgi:hypothetical protein
MIFSGKGIHWYFLFSSTTRLLLNMHFKSCISCLFQVYKCLYKCHIINFLLTSFARYVQRNIGPQSFRTNVALRARSVQKRPRSDISLYRPRARLIHWVPALSPWQVKSSLCCGFKHLCVHTFHTYPDSWWLQILCGQIIESQASFKCDSGIWSRKESCINNFLF